MTPYLVRRILLMFPTLVGITLVVFVVMASSPGGISAQALIEGRNLEPQARKALEDYYNRLYCHVPQIRADRRSSLPKIDSAVAAQTKGEAQALWFAMNASIVLTS